MSWRQAAATDARTEGSTTSSQLRPTTASRLTPLSSHHRSLTRVQQPEASVANTPTGRRSTSAASSGVARRGSLPVVPAVMGSPVSLTQPSLLRQ